MDDTGFDSWGMMTSQLSPMDLVGIETTRRERVPFWEPVIPVEDPAWVPFPSARLVGLTTAALS